MTTAAAGGYLPVATAGHHPRLLSLAAGTVRELDPPATVVAAATAGWPASGLAVDPHSWNPGVAAATRRRLDDTGVIALDVEAVFVTPDGDPGDLLVDAASELGARHVLVVGLGIELAAFTDRFADLCDRAAPAGVTCVVEFMPVLAVPDLATALAVVADAARPNAGVLVDSLHLARSGSTPADLAPLDAACLPYLQICDAPATATAATSAATGTTGATAATAATGADLLDEALEGRTLPGHGGLPLSELLDVLDATAPQAALSVEVLSRQLRALHPDPTQRARAVLEATRRLLEERTGSLS